MKKLATGRNHGIARRLTGASLIALGMGSFCTPAMAQSATASAPAVEENSTGLSEIIVTARKVEENLQDVPVAVTVFSGQDLQNQNIQKIQDIANFTPGLAIRPGQSGPTSLTITLRGQVQTDVLATLDPSVGTYVDGVYWARAFGLNASLLDIRSVQVLKGPQGTLFGRNTTGGALLINSNDPDLNDFTGRISGTYGRFNEREGTVVLNAPIIRDRIAIRLAGTRFKRDGYVTNIAPATATTALIGSTVVVKGPFPGSLNGRKSEERDRWNARGKLLIQATDTLSLLFSGEYFDQDEEAQTRTIRLATDRYVASNTTYNVANTSGLFVGLITGSPFATAAVNGNALLNAQAALLDARPRKASYNDPSYAGARTYTYGLTAALETPWGEARLITGARQVKAFSGVDLEGSSYAVHFTEGQQKIKQQSAELQTTGKAFNNALDFALGAFVFHESGFDQSISITVPALNPATSHFYGLINNDSIGVYGQGTYHITDALSFTGGLRYSVDDKGLETRNNNFIRTSGLTICSIIPVAPFNAGGEVVGPAQCGFRRRDSFSGVSYTAGLDYRVSDDVLVYAKTAKGFRSGGQNLRAPNTVSFIPFDPEVAYSYEVGIKSEFLNRRVRVNASAYTTDVNDIQRSTLIATAPIPPSTVSGTATILGNAGKARFRGVELEVQAVVFPGFRLSASGALVDPKYVRFADLSGDRSFERFTGVAKKQFALAADYSTDFGSDAKLNLHADYAWRAKVPTGEYFFAANPQNQAIVDATTAPSLGLFGMRASVEYGEHIEFAVFGRNLTNERKFIQNLIVAPLGYISGVRQEPRTYGVSGTFKF